MDGLSSNQISFLEELEKKKQQQNPQPKNSLGQPVNGAINEVGEGFYANPWAGQQEVQEQSQGNEYLEAIKRGLGSGAVGVLSGLGGVGQVALGTDGSMVDAIENYSQQNFGRKREWSYQDIANDFVGWLTDPYGATYAGSNQLGSMGALTAGGALASYLAPEVAITGATGYLIKVANALFKASGGKLGMAAADMAEFLAKPAGKALAAKFAGNAIESLSEGGSAGREKLAETGDRAEAIKSMAVDTVLNMALLGTSGALETANIAGMIKGNGAGAAVRYGLGTGLEAAQQAGEEGGQQTISEASQGKTAYSNIIQPWNWSQSAKDQAIEAGLISPILSGAQTLGGKAANKVFSNQQPNEADQATNNTTEEQQQAQDQEQSQNQEQAGNFRRTPIAEGIEDEGLSNTNPNLVQGVDALNTWAYQNFGKDMLVSGGARSEENNKAVNGSPTSHHLYGNAIDIDLSAFDEAERQAIMEKAKAMGFNSDGEDMYHDKGTGLHMHLILPAEGGLNFNGMNSTNIEQSSLQGDTEGLETASNIYDDAGNTDDSAATAVNALSPEAQMFNEALQSSDRYQQQGQPDTGAVDYVAQLEELNNTIAQYEQAMQNISNVASGAGSNAMDKAFIEYYKKQLDGLYEQRNKIAPLANAQKASAPANFKRKEKQERKAPAPQQKKADDAVNKLDIEAPAVNDWASVTDQQLFDYVRRRPNEATAKAAEEEIRRRGLAKSDRNVGEVVPASENAVARVTGLTTNPGYSNRGTQQIYGMEALPEHNEKYAGSNKINNLVDKVRAEREEKKNLDDNEEPSRIVRTTSGDRFINTKAAQKILEQDKVGNVTDTEIIPASKQDRRRLVESMVDKARANIEKAKQEALDYEWLTMEHEKNLRGYASVDEVRQTDSAMLKKAAADRNLEAITRKAMEGNKTSQNAFGKMSPAVKAFLMQREIDKLVKESDLENQKEATPDRAKSTFMPSAYLKLQSEGRGAEYEKVQARAAEKKKKANENSTSETSKDNGNNNENAKPNQAQEEKTEPNKGEENKTALPNKEIKGKGVTVVTDKGTEIKAVYKLIDADEIVTSNKPNNSFDKNPNYPEELQPRDRLTATMRQQVMRMAKSLRPADLGASRNLNAGAPIVNGKNIVMNGNGRAMAIIRALKGKGQVATSYKAYIQSHAAEFGFTLQEINSIKNPILVREIDGNANVQEIINSTSGGAKMGAREQAKADAKRITLNTLNLYRENDEADITTAENADFVREALSEITQNDPNELNDLVTADGKQISQAGVNRIKNALFAKAYNDDNIISAMSEATDTNIKNIIKALLNSAAKAASVKVKADQGNLYDVKFDEPVLEACKKMMSLRSEGKPVSVFLKEQNMFGEDISSAAKSILEFFDKNKQRPKKIAQMLSSMAEQIEKQGNPNQGALFGEAKAPTVDEIVNNAIKYTNGEMQGNLFGGEGNQSGVETRPSLETANENISAKSNELVNRLNEEVKDKANKAMSAAFVRVKFFNELRDEYTKEKEKLSKDGATADQLEDLKNTFDSARDKLHKAFETYEGKPEPKKKPAYKETLGSAVFYHENNDALTYGAGNYTYRLQKADGRFYVTKKDVTHNEVVENKSFKTKAGAELYITRDSNKQANEETLNANNEGKDNNIQNAKPEKAGKQEGASSKGKKNKAEDLKSPKGKQQNLQDKVDQVLGDTLELNASSFENQESRDYFRAALKNRFKKFFNYNEKQIDKLVDDLIDRQGVILENLKKLISPDSTMAEWQNRDINGVMSVEFKGQTLNIRYRKEGNEKIGSGSNAYTMKNKVIRSAFKKNGEYELNIDLGTLCTKREPIDTLINVLNNMEGELINNLGISQYGALKNILKEEGFLTACDICFVETKRIRALNDANKWSFEWSCVLDALGLNDGTKLGERERISPDSEVYRMLEQMAGFEHGQAEKYLNASSEAKRKQITNADKRKAISQKAYDALIPAESKRTKKYKLDKEGNVQYDEEGNPILGADLDSGITMDKMQKIATLMLQDTTMCGEFGPSILLDANGTDWLFRNFADTNVAGTVAGMFGTATAKPLEGFNIYDPMSWFKAFDTKVINQKLYDHIFDIGGFRCQSFTDFNIIQFFDYVQMFADMEARRIPLHMYTKVPALVEIFGTTGAKINMSLVAKVEEDVDSKHIGLRRATEAEKNAYADSVKKGTVEQDIADGKIVRVNDEGWTYSWGEESFPVGKAFKYRADKRYNGNVGIIAVALSDEHGKMMLADPTIDMVIPFHKSGMPGATQRKTGLDIATDYTDTQTTKTITGAKLRGEKGVYIIKSTMAQYKDSKGKAKYDSFDHVMRQVGNPQEAARQYIEMCQDARLVPEFEQFAYQYKEKDGKQYVVYDDGKELQVEWDGKAGRYGVVVDVLADDNGKAIVKNGRTTNLLMPILTQGTPVLNKNYYKVLENFRVYDNDGKYAPQNAVRLNLTDNWQTSVKEALDERTETVDKPLQELRQGTLKTKRAQKYEELAKSDNAADREQAKAYEKYKDELVTDRCIDAMERERLELDARETMMAGLERALGKENIQTLRQSKFFDALQKEYENETDAERAKAKVEVFRNGRGIVYGFAKNGKIILNEDNFNAATPAHEFTHVWAKVLQSTPEGKAFWKKGVELLKETEVWREVVKDATNGVNPIYGNIAGKEDAIASEALARIVGSANEEFIKILANPKNKLTKAEGMKLALAKALNNEETADSEKVATLAEYIREFFTKVKDAFQELRYKYFSGDKSAFSEQPLKLEEFIRMPLTAIFDEAEGNAFKKAMAIAQMDEETASVGETETANASAELSAEDNSRPLLAPNGKPSNLTPEQYAQVRTPEFKRWFGDWENDPRNASKVVDENGEPKVMYHGTMAYGFTVFNTSEENTNHGSHFGTQSQARVFDESGNNTYNVFLNIRNPWEAWDYFADDVVYAVADIADMAKTVPKENVLAAENILSDLEEKFPFVRMSDSDERYEELSRFIDEDEDTLTSSMEGNGYREQSNNLEKFVDKAYRKMLDLCGYDGVVYQNMYEDGENLDNSYIVQKSNQIKSATDNNGNFSTEDDDIRYSVKQEQVMKRSYAEVEAEIKAAFPGGKIIETKNGFSIIEMPDGSKFAYSIKDNIILNKKQQKKADEAHNTKGGKAQGYWGKFNQAGAKRILVVSRNSQIGTAFHEALHAAIDMALTAKEKTALYNYYKNVAKAQGRDVEEVVADSYRDWVLARQKGNGSTFGKLWRKVKDFCTRVQGLFNKGAEVQRIFQDVESGAVYKRKHNQKAVEKGRKLLAQIAYHGSPYKFDEFTLEHIGAGEGSQVHGWGLYFAKDKAVAEGYKEKLSEGGEGSLYTVDIPNDDVLLNEDLMLNEQPPKVKAALKRVIKKLDAKYPVFKRELKHFKTIDEFMERTSAEDFYEGVSRIIDGETDEDVVDWNFSAGSDREVSLMLNEEGIEGILYDGTVDGDCVVVFNDKAIKMLDKIEKAKDVNAKDISAEAKSIEQVRKQYEGTKQWMKAPNGKPSNLDEKQWLQVRTPEFKRWFGDWENDPENASKVVDENGEPLVVYHGTNSEFFAFDQSTWGKYDNGSKLDFVNGKIVTIKDNMFFFTSDKKLAEEHAEGSVELSGEGKPRVIACFIASKKTLDETFDEFYARKKYYSSQDYYDKNTSKFQKRMSDGEYDALVLHNPIHKNDVLVGAINPNQIKSATDNNGNFSTEDEDIRYSVATADGISFTTDKSLLGIEEAGGIKPWFKKQWHQFYRDWFDKNDALHDLDMAFSLGLGRQLTEGEKVYNKVQTLPASAAGMAQALVEGSDAHIHALNEKLGLKGNKMLHLVSLAKVLDTISDKKMNKAYPDFLSQHGKKNWVDALSQYLGYERLLEMKQISEDAGEQYKLPNGLTEKDIKDYIKAAPAEFKRAATQYYLVNDNMLKLMESAGLISEQTHQLLNTKYKKYCPLMRDFSDTAAADMFIQGLTNGGKGIANVSSMLKKISIDGSDRTVISPIESTVKALAVCANRCERNRVAQMAVNLAKQANGALDAIIKPVPGGTSDAKNCIFTVMFDGKKEAYQTTQDLYSPIVGYNIPAAGMVLGLAKTCATVLRTGATSSGSFVLRNVIRDTLFAGISSKSGFIPFVDTFRGAYALWKNEKAKAEFEAGGVTGFNFYNNKVSNYNDLVRLNGKGIDWHKPSAIWEGIKLLGGKAEEFSAFWESATRMGEFLKAREKGMSIDEAVRAARELTLDFSRSGVVGQNVNQYIPFFNACLQGGDKMVRLLHDDFVGTSTKLAEYILIPTLILWAFNHDEDWYKELEPRIKYSHWCLPGGIRIPLPQEAGITFGGGLMAALDQAFNNDPRAIGYWADEVKSTAKPNIIPTVFLPIIEWQANYSFFKGGPLVAKRLQALPDEQQFTNHTATLSKGLGKVTGLSPVKIDNTVRGYTGTMGMFLWQAGDVLEDKNEPEKKLSERQFIRDFNVNDQHRNRYLNEFYELRDAADKQHAGYGKKGSPSADVVQIRKYATIISGLNKDIQKITDSKALSPERKRALIDNKKERIKAVAKRAVDKYGDKYL